MLTSLPEIDSSRIKTLRIGNVEGECVVYMMSRDQRVYDNHALLYAQADARQKKLPLVVMFCLSSKVGYRAREHYIFMLDGLKQVADELQKYAIPFTLEVGSSKQSLLDRLAILRPSSVYFDFSPLRGAANMRTAVAENYQGSVFVVDTHNIVPVWTASDKKEVAAYTLRPKIHKLIELYLSYPAMPVVHEYTWQKGALPSFADCEASIARILAAVPSNGVNSTIESGENAAHTKLENFITNEIDKYAHKRNDPSLDGQSGLSPYLHFGQISSLRVALELRQLTLNKKSDLHIVLSPKMPKTEDVEPSLLDGMHALLEEMIIRKELSDNFCYYDSHYDQLVAAPKWAQASLEAHAKDVREYLYTLEEFEQALTHDRAWNAAQKQLTSTGKIHGYMRMYWAKKVLEWSPSPVEAQKTLVYLNDFYSLDGGDPNGYAGIAWSVAGVHDRPWAERPVFGVIRYMNFAGLKRKFDIEAYCMRYLN